MTTLEIINELQGIVGPAYVLYSAEDLTTYSYDGTAGIATGTPMAVVQPVSTEEVSAIMHLADREEIVVVPRGSGTGLSGGSTAINGCLILQLNRMNRILEIDTINLTAFVEPGVITADLDKAAAELGLFYPPDPGSMKISTMGGNVAENSGGLRCFKYGVTEDYLMGLEVVLPDGRVFWTGGKTKKDVAGYNLKKMFASSEGTLGVVTKILVRLIPRPPAVATLLAYYDDVAQAGDTVTAMVAAGIIPCTVEFLDNVVINTVEDFAQLGLPRDATALLLIQTDGHPAVVEDEAQKIEQLCLQQGAREVKRAKDMAEGDRLAAARRNAFSSLARISPTTVLEDASVPRSELATMLTFIQDVAKRYNLRIGTFGHAGDGNLHPTVLIDERHEDEMHRMHQAFEEIFAKAIELGGTVTGEHGVGYAKREFLPSMLGDTGMDVTRRIKRALDPKGILNPGKMLTVEEVQ